MTGAERQQIHAAIEGLILSRQMRFTITRVGVRCLVKQYRVADIYARLDYAAEAVHP